MEQKNNTAAYLYAGLTIFLWASSFPAVKYALNYYSPGPLMLLRFLIASVTISIIAYINKIRLPEREDVLYVVSCGAIGIFIYMWLFNTGTELVKSGISSFVIATAPIFTMIMSSVYLKEKPRIQTVAGVIISALGLLLIAFGQIREFSLNAGIMILLLASVCTSLYNTMQRKISSKYTPIERTAYSIVVGTVFMLIFSPGLVAEFRAAPLRADAVLVYLGVFPAAFAYLSWNYALGKAEKVTNVTNFMYLTPFLATALAFILLGEVLSVLSFAGGIIIIAGMVFSNWNSAGNKKEGKSAAALPANQD